MRILLFMRYFLKMYYCIWFNVSVCPNIPQNDVLDKPLKSMMWEKVEK